MRTPHVNWSTEEIEATVAAYADLSVRLERGERIVKRDVYQALSEQYGGRKLSAYARRFSNISHILLEMGLARMPGMGPQANMGPNAEKIIRQALENRGYATAVGPNDTVASLLATRPLPPRPLGNPRPPRRPVMVEQTVRDQAVVDWVLATAAGHCENCGQPAPFVREDGTPYLEVHHVKWLAREGSDTVTNAVALCPNCHRLFHYGANAAQLAASIIGRVERLVAE